MLPTEVGAAAFFRHLANERLFRDARIGGVMARTGNCVTSSAGQFGDTAVRGATTRRSDLITTDILPDRRKKHEPDDLGGGSRI